MVTVSTGASDPGVGGREDGECGRDLLRLGAYPPHPHVSHFPIALGTSHSVVTGQGECTRGPFNSLVKAVSSTSLL